MKALFLILSIFCQSFTGYSQNKTADSLRKKGFEIFQQNQLDSLKSLQLLRKSQGIYLQNRAFTPYAEVFLYTGEIYFEAGNFQKALQEFYVGAKSLETDKSPSSDSTLFKLYESIGFLLQKDLQYDQSKVYFDKAEKLLNNNRKKFQTKSILPYIYAFYSNYGVTFNILGDYKRASLYFEKASEIGRFPEVKFLLNFGLRDEAQLAMEMGNYSKSSKLLKEAVDATRFEMDRCNQLSELGKNYFLANNYQEAEKYLNKAYQLLTIVKNKKVEFVRSDLEKALLNTLGDLKNAQRKYADAQKYYQKSLSISVSNNPSGKDIYASKSLLGLGEVSENQTSTSKALAFYQKAISAIHQDFDVLDIYQNPTLSGVLSPKDMFNALQHKASAFYQLYQDKHSMKDLKMAASTYQLAIELSEKMRRSYESADAKLFFINKVFPVFSEAMEVGFQLYQQTKLPVYQELMFEINEKSKASTLADAIRDIMIKPKQINVELLNQERKLHQTINTLQSKIAKETKSDEVKNLHKSLVDKELELLHLLQSYETQFPNYSQLKYNFSTISIPQIQAKLAPETAFISYFLGEKKYAFFITKTSSNIVKLTDDLSLESNTKSLISELYRKPGLDVYKGSVQGSVIPIFCTNLLENSLTKPN
ncbi:MAG: tetratricopeptide repeat protein [Arcicella sp.]|nr:tetratricopeptide repeat protein [Arcicella sp.]